MVLDLDHTLVHTLDPRVPHHRDESIEPAMMIRLRREEYGHLFLRPFAIEFINAAKEYFEISIFTAASEGYATQVIEYINSKTDNAISTQLYRDACTRSLSLRKDLRLYNRLFKDIFIVDDAATVIQEENRVNIKPWTYRIQDDRCLADLMLHFEGLSKCNDMRDYIKDKIAK